MIGAPNVHATAIVLGTRGFLIVGPSGSGKTSLALSLLADAADEGLHAALVADDQVFIVSHGGRSLARRPNSIKGLVEIREAGIVAMQSVALAVLDCAILPVLSSTATRLPPEDERFDLPTGNALPLLRLPRDGALNPLRILQRMLPDIAGFQG